MANQQRIRDYLRKKAEEKSGPPASDKSSGRAKRQTTPASSDKPSPAGERTLKAPKPGIVEVYYDCLTSSYYACNAHGEYQRWQKDDLKLLLRRNAYSTALKDDYGLSFLEGELLRITQEQSVHFAGALGGYEPGIYDIHASRVLVTRGPQFLKPQQGSWNTLKDFFGHLLGEQAQYLYAWLKVATQGLRRGYPWPAGQLLALGGPPGCGKSVTQNLITPLLGGRVSSPYTYLSSGTNFNAEIYAAEHGLIGDVNHAIDNKSRRNFGAAIKKLVAEPVHYLHAKGRTPITLTPFLRLTLSLNDNPQALSILPSFDSDVQGKIMLLRCRPADVEKRKKRWPQYQDFWRQLVLELPAMLHALSRWQIPERIRDERYGVISFHDPELVEKVNQLSEEERLLELIDTLIFHSASAEWWEGTSVELEKAIADSSGKGSSFTFFRYSSHCGQLLDTLGKKYPERIGRRRVGGHRWKYRIEKVQEE